MNKKLLFFLLPFLLSLHAISQTSPKRELRGAWIATYANIDWPNRAQTPAQQQAALLSILNHHQATGINTIYLQVRSQCDALYASTIDPWSADLTGVQGQKPNPFWDPLEFAINECHKRGMELHAWINPYRAVANANQLSGFASTHVAKLHPDWLITTGTLRTLNPGISDVRDYITNVISNIVKDYDVDGIHFDDYFYPNATFNDDSVFNTNSRGFTNRADWRRDNINLLIKRVNETITHLKPWVKFGVSPSGIYRNSTNPAIGTPTSGLEHYTTLYADSKKWLQEGWVDYIAPQVYWYMGQPGANYTLIVPWWNDQANGRHIYIGMAGYKVNDPAQGVNWANPSQIPNEMRLNRKAGYSNIYGQIIYNTSALRSTTKLGFRDSLRLDFYRKPALQPTMPWKDNTPPAAPTLLEGVRQTNSAYVLTWNRPAATNDEMDKVRQFAIYRSESPVIDIQSSDNLLAITNSDENTYIDNTTDPAKTYYYTVTALDRFHNESTPSNVTDYAAPIITGPGQQQLNLGASCSIILPDYTGMATVSDDISAPSAITITQSPAAGSTIYGSATTVVTLTATDASGKTATWNFDVVTKDISAPVITACAPNQNVGTDAGQCAATITISEPVVTDNCGVTSITGTRSDNQPLTASYPKGTTTITWVAVDAAGNSATCTQSITVSDTEAPTISGLSADPSTLTVPNHKMRDVTIGYTLSDNCGPVSSTIAVSSNEPRDGKGDGGDKGPDWKIIDEHHVQLRAERSGTGTGRIYTITITATDAVGNISTRNVLVTVPHAASGTTLQTGAQELALVSSLGVKASPNPAVNYFIIQTQSGSDAPLTITITDANGKVIERRRSVAANGILRLGQEYRPGVYFIEVSQGKDKQSLKLIKQAGK